MPKKLQLKLLSKSGELLRMVTCQAGRVSVLRASVPSDLRPYQRALAGSSGKDNIVVTCDGVQYSPEEHILIGFGEQSPTSGLSVKEFLSQWEIPTTSFDPLLRSLGLEQILEKRCSELSVEQEARLRLLAATTNPGKILVLNDPFEHISGQWRDRAADLLTTFAESKQAIVVIPSLSFRPESWIENRVIERIEVGQTSQGTIGFGSAGSESNAAMNELLSKIRQDPRFAQAGSSEERGAPMALAASAIGLQTQSTDDELVEQNEPSRWTPLLKMGSIVTGVGLTAGIAFLMLGSVSPNDADNAQAPQALARVDAPADSKAQPNSAGKNIAAGGQPDTNTDVKKGDISAASLNQQRREEPTPETFLLDRYPPLIKASLLDTVRGVNNFAPAPNQPQAPKSASGDAQSGNLFKLLEKASNNGPAGQAAPMDPYDFQPPNQADAFEIMNEEPVIPMDPTEEEAKRDEIRNRFLEAIRAAAEQRDPAMGAME